MATLPFENTKVPSQKSMMDIMLMLEMTGFTKTMQLNDAGRRSIHAIYHSAEFMFEVDISAVTQTLITNAPKYKQREIRQKTATGNAFAEDIRDRSSRIGWRLMAEYVKGVCDGIKLGVISPAQAFAGNLIITDASGQRIRLAEHLTTAIETDTLKSGAFTGPLMIEAPQGK